MNSKRTFLLGAGFSKAVANAPLMIELWRKIEEVYNKEKTKKYGRNREKWYNDLNEFINMLEYNAKTNVKRLFDEHKVNGGIRDNLEYLLH